MCCFFGPRCISCCRLRLQSSADTSNYTIADRNPIFAVRISIVSHSIKAINISGFGSHFRLSAITAIAYRDTATFAVGLVTIYLLYLRRQIISTSGLDGHIAIVGCRQPPHIFGLEPPLNVNIQQTRFFVNQQIFAYCRQQLVTSHSYVNSYIEMKANV